MKWDNRSEATKQYQRKQKKEYGWGGTHSIWDGKHVVLFIIVGLICIALDLTVFKVWFGWPK